MKTNLIQTCLLATALLALPAVPQEQFTYLVKNGAITITKFGSERPDEEHDPVGLFWIFRPTWPTCFNI